MSDPIRIPGNIPPLNNATNPNGVSNTNPTSNVSFNEILRAKQGIAPGAPGRGSSEAVRFSAHAQTRLHSRHIELEDSQLARLDGAVQKAANKGSRDALVLMDDLAMVVSVKNRTVVTVVEKENLQQNVFTNIDSAVIA
jgi:flagellar operon protein